MQNLKLPWGRKPLFYGWVVAFIAMVASFASGPGQAFVFAMFVDPIMADVGVSRTQISALYAVGTCISAAVALGASYIIDNLGPRKMLLYSAVVFGLACIGISFATGMVSLMVGFAALRALGQSAIAVSVTLLTAQWFVRYRGRAMAIMSMGFSLSNALFPPISQMLITWLGWRDAYRTLGVAVWIMILPATFFLVRDRPEQMGLHTDGLPPDPDQPQPTPDRQENSHQRPVIWRSLRFWILALPRCAGPFVTTSIFAERGLSPEVAASAFIPFALTSALTTVVVGFLAEHIEPKWILLGNLIFLIVGVLFLQLVSSPLEAVIYSLIVGAFAGTLSVVSNVLWAYYYGRENLGAYQGASLTVIITGAAIGPLPLAAFQGIFGNYTVGLYVYASLPLICALPLLWFRSRYSASQPTKTSYATSG
jgi:MFS family permease